MGLGKSEQALQKVILFRTVATNITMPDSAAEDVMPAVFDLNANWARRSTNEVEMSPNVKYSDLTLEMPF